jgi:hypothetical protein
MDAPTATLIVGGLTFLGGLSALYYSRQLTRSQAHGADAVTFDKFTETFAKLQQRNDELYQENVQLEIKNTEKSRSMEQLTTRLAERDAQLTQATKQLDLLREMARSVPITDTLKNQLDAMNIIITNLQASGTAMQELMAKREEAIGVLLESQRTKKGTAPQ